MKILIGILIGLLIGAVGGFVYGEYVYKKTSSWYDIMGYRDKTFLRMQLMEFYAMECNSSEVKHIRTLFNSELTLYKSQLSKVADMPFVNGKFFSSEHESNISELENRSDNIQQILSSCNNL